MRNTVPYYVFERRYDNYIFLDGSSPSTSLMEEFLKCCGPVEAIFFDEAYDNKPAEVFYFDSPASVDLARNNPETWFRMFPTGYLYAETDHWGVFASMVDEITVLGYNSKCEVQLDFLNRAYRTIIWTIEEAGDASRPSPYWSAQERETFKRIMRENYYETGRGAL